MPLTVIQRHRAKRVLPGTVASRTGHPHPKTWQPCLGNRCLDSDTCQIPTCGMFPQERLQSENTGLGRSSLHLEVK
jgi:hypothetical protein